MSESVRSMKGSDRLLLSLGCCGIQQTIERDARATVERNILSICVVRMQVPRVLHLTHPRKMTYAESR